MFEPAPPTPVLTVGQFLSDWLTNAAKPSLRATTFLRYEGMVRGTLIPMLGAEALATLAPLKIQAMLTTMQEAGRGLRSCQIAYGVLHRALGRAVKWELISRNPCSLVEKPKAPRAAMKFLTPVQAQTLLAAAEGDRLYALYVLAVTTGLWQGELLGLQWSDVDLDGKALTVQRTLLEIVGRHQLAEPKTAKGRRKVDLPGLAVRALSKHKRTMLAEGHDTAFVFCDTEGGPLRKNNLMNRSFRPLLKRAGLPKIRFHDLRHTAATLLLSQGIHPKIVQERLGHAQIAVTLDTYSHVLPSMQREAAEKLDGLLGL